MKMKAAAPISAYCRRFRRVGFHLSMIVHDNNASNAPSDPLDSLALISRSHKRASRVWVLSSIAYQNILRRQGRESDERSINKIEVRGTKIRGKWKGNM